MVYMYNISMSSSKQLLRWKIKKTKHFGQFWLQPICVDDMQLMLLHCLINAKYMETQKRE